MTTEKDVLRVPFGEVARIAEEAPRKNKNKKRHKNTDGNPTHSAKEASMTQQVPETLMHNTNAKDQEKALTPSRFSNSLSQHMGEFSTAFSYAAGAVAGGLVIVGIAALVQRGVNAALGGGTSTDDVE